MTNRTNAFGRELTDVEVAFNDLVSTLQDATRCNLAEATQLANAITQVSYLNSIAAAEASMDVHLTEWTHTP